MLAINIGDDFPILSTERLHLRRLIREDGWALAGIMSEDGVAKLVLINALKDDTRVKDMVIVINELFKQKEAVYWAVVRKEDNKLIGICGLTAWIKGQELHAELGYELGRSFWRHGYMTEALDRVLTYAFEIMALDRVEAIVTPDAVRSKKLLLNLGFKDEGVYCECPRVQEHFWDEHCFSIDKNEWLIKKSIDRASSSQSD